ncbi:hypothetical protein ONS95_011074 [Cadophora gregata]|uniref:uncharacterized protein n=1 Tax=Cadophora gregata TaxID=51156 RepID=UPI0026DC012B|nr:uncharacterized protein ONS95_011074 [Cadophora gregata]KAK0119636.1 hypothetical protein ONS95_011074 [Cadophora gregata]KAK0120673.1 hypothetical protein ONS96_010873 [Cadophora gregata f. sp. sojae]
MYNANFKMNQMYLPGKKTAFGSACVAAALLAVFWSNQQHVDSEARIQTPHNYECKPHNYTTEIVSVEPLLIYINDFLSSEEADLLVDLGTPSLASSEIYVNGQKVSSKTRTSRSGGLPPSSPLVSCILTRALTFLGPAIPSTKSHPYSSSSSQNSNPNPLSIFGTPQIVQYGPGEHFSTHHDWYDRPQPLRDGSMDYTGGRWSFNRWGSFFVYLDEEAVGGETWFPHIEARTPVLSSQGEDSEGGGEKRKWEKNTEEGRGTNFLPRKGNALFWVNLHGNGTGDERVVHAGREVKGGKKTAMNLWPRVYYGGGGR